MADYRRSVSLLLIEDSPDDAMLFDRALRKDKEHEFHLNYAFSLVEGLEALKSRPYDIAVVDLALPDSVGLPTVMRVLDAAPAMPVVVMTGAYDPDVATQAIQAGAEDYVVKGSADGAVLVRTLKNALHRNKIKADLRSAQERFRTVVDSANDAILIVNDDNRITFLNPAAARLWERSADRVIGTSFLELFSSDTARQVAARMIEPSTVADGGAKPVVAEAAIPSGGRVPVEISVNPWLLEGVPHFTAIVRDITEEQRQRANRFKSEFVSVVSHELRTPLTSLLGAVKLVRSGVVGDVSDKAAQLLGLAQGNGERLLCIINDILDMSKLEAGQISVHYETAPIMEMVRQATRDNEHYAKEFQTRFVIRRQVDEDRAIRVDRNRFLQIMANLMSNAAKYAHPNTDVDVDVTSADGALRVAVTDYGEAIPESFRAQLFQPFSQADCSTTRKVGGTGLGLKITKQLVEVMGGAIDFESDPGRGTTFHVTFPEDANAESALPQ
jgi:PAS domain S-box-containing protein